MPMKVSRRLPAKKLTFLRDPARGVVSRGMLGWSHQYTASAHIGLSAIPNPCRRSNITLQGAERFVRPYVILMDPMLATGQSAVRRGFALKDARRRDTRFVCLLVQPRGVIAHFQLSIPDVLSGRPAIDENLNDARLFLPGWATPAIACTASK